MSAFLVNAATMDAAVTAIIDHADRFAEVFTYRDWEPGHPPHASLWTMRQRQAGTAIGFELLTMNAKALNERYGDDPDDVPTYTFRPHTTLSPVERLKCLDCLIYQCAEGHVPDSPLYQELTDLSRRIAQHIVEASPEYARADWGRYGDT